MSCARRSCCPTTCTTSCGSCRRPAVSAVVTQPVQTTGTVPSNGVLLAEEEPLLFNVACTSNVVMEISGSIFRETASPGPGDTYTFELAMEYYNILSPGFPNTVSIPVDVTVPENGTYVPFAVVQSATLTPGTYASQLSISLGPAETAIITVAGFQSVLIVRQ